MANISSLSASTNSAMSSLRGYGGLASGLDRDELIQGMTSGTQTKITKQQQAKTKLEWQQAAYREISDKMISFADKYTATMSSSTNLFSDAFWGAATTTALGTNSKYISVSGSSKAAAANVSILGVKQMAKNAAMTMNKTVSDRALSTGDIKTDWQDVSTVAGKNLQFKIGDKSYSVSLPYGNGDQYDTLDQVVTALNQALAKEEVTFSNGSAKTGKLSDFIVASAKDGKLVLEAKGSNAVKLTGGTALEALGFKEQVDATKEKGVIQGLELGKGENAATAGKEAVLLEEQSFAQRMGGKSLAFNYNGTTKWITLPSASELYQYASGKDIAVDKNGYLLDEDGLRFDKDGQRINAKGNLIDEDGNEIKDENGESIKGEPAKFGKVDKDGNILDQNNEIVKGKDGQPLKAQERSDQLTYVQEALQKSLDAAFGKGRVEAKIETNEATNEKRLTFRTITPDGNEDNSSTLSIADGSASLLASKGGLGIVSGESNRLNLNTSIKNSGLNGATTMSGAYELDINGTKFSFTEKDTISSIMDKINKSDAGVKISYMTTADKFVIESTDAGASGKIELSGNGAELLFGKKEETEGDGGYKVADGQDAIVTVKYAGSNEPVDLQRGSNNFSIDGLNVTVKGEFGYKEVEETAEDGSTKTVKKLTNDLDDIVTFETNVSSEKMVSAISDLVKEYNEILELVNSQLSTRPDKDYFPLTDDQKKEMSESEIKIWEDKAKEGILFGSSELRSLADDLRWAILPKDQQAMEAFGISVSSSWQDNGKLSFDETKFKAALESDPDAVKAAFTKSDGIASNLKNTMEKYVKTMGATKGILIEKAGSTKSPTSMLNNSLKTQIDDIDKILENLKTRLKSEQDRYISQFTQLETLISQMNSQSSYLSGLGF